MIMIINKYIIRKTTTKIIQMMNKINKKEEIKQNYYDY
jgi:hypothetical protein